MGSGKCRLQKIIDLTVQRQNKTTWTVKASLQNLRKWVKFPLALNLRALVRVTGRLSDTHLVAMHLDWNLTTMIESGVHPVAYGF
jgi:hypothetical protein